MKKETVELIHPPYRKFERMCRAQRTLNSGDTYTHTITKSELYQGQQITYYPPFDKCDRVEDYKVAWEWFEGVFGEKQLV